MLEAATFLSTSQFSLSSIRLRPHSPSWLTKIFAVEQFGDLLGEIDGIIGDCVKCCRSCYIPPLLQVEEHHWQANAMYSRILIIVELSFIAFFGSGATPTSPLER